MFKRILATFLAAALLAGGIGIFGYNTDAQADYTFVPFEGKVMTYGPMEGNEKVSEDSVFVYYLYNPFTGRELYTTDEREVSVLNASLEWAVVAERGWYAPAKGTPVYRVCNNKIGYHLYTSSNNEVNTLTKSGDWSVDNKGKPLFYSGGDYTIYRLYNNITGIHMYTPNVNEYNEKAGKDGWTKDTVTFKAEYAKPDLKSPLDYIVPIEKLDNLKSIKKSCTDAEFMEAYKKSLIYVAELVYKSDEDKLLYTVGTLRHMAETSVYYNDEDKHYNDPYGYMVLGYSSCAGCTRTTGLWLNMLGLKYEHINENQWEHQWCRVSMPNGSFWVADPYGYYVGPEKEAYKHPNF